MRKNKALLFAGVLAGSLALAAGAQANNIGFSFSGGGISGGGTLTFDPTNVDAVSGGLAVTGFTGSFSDSNLSLTNVAITGLVTLNPVNPPHGAPFPNAMSLYAVTNPPPPDSSISYDNLLYPGGSPITCDGYPFSGGYLDVYGLMLTLGNGDLVDLYSNGNLPGAGPNIYGAIVIDTSLASQNNGAGTIVDNVGAGIGVAVPEPGMLGLFGLGLAGLGFGVTRRRKRA